MTQYHLRNLLMGQVNSDSYAAALKTLNNLHRYREHLGTQNKSPSARVRTQEWLQILGISQETLKNIRFVHVAGTKGKGTTCLYCESMLNAYEQTAYKPLKVGCLTSPHVTNIRERIRIDAAPISEQLFASHFFKIWETIMKHYASDNKSKPSLPGYPGFLALLGIYILVKENVNVAVVETGVGGEHDSTNVIPSPVVTGITTIGLDHVNVLGNNLGSIAWHKAGIFKQGSPAYTVEQDNLVLKVLQDRAKEKKISGDLVVVPERLVDCYGVTVEPNMGFQKRNASLAIALVNSHLKGLYPNFSMTPELVRVIERTELPGRNQIIERGKFKWYISSAHNEISAEATSKWYEDAIERSGNPTVPRVLIFSETSQRDPNPILRKLFVTLQSSARSFDDIIFCSNTTGLEGEITDFFDPRNVGKLISDTHERLASEWSSSIGKQIIAKSSVKDAINTVKDRYSHVGARTLIVGSVYQAGAAIIML